MVEHQIKDFNQLIENPEKVIEKELTYISKLTTKYPSSNFCLCLPNTSLPKKNWI